MKKCGASIAGLSNKKGKKDRDVKISVSEKTNDM